MPPPAGPTVPAVLVAAVDVGSNAMRFLATEVDASGVQAVSHHRALATSAVRESRNGTEPVTRARAAAYRHVTNATREFVAVQRLFERRDHDARGSIATPPLRWYTCTASPRGHPPAAPVRRTMSSEP